MNERTRRLMDASVAAMRAKHHPAPNLTTVAEWAEKDIADLRRALADALDDRRKARAERDLLKDRIRRTCDRIEAQDAPADAGPGFTSGATYAAREIRKAIT